MQDYICPNENCKNHQKPTGNWYWKRGYFKTRHNGQPVPRYECKECGKRFSSHTFRDTYGQHKPEVNDDVFKLYCSGTTQRRLAKVLQVNRKTIVRKFVWLSEKARRVHDLSLQQGGIKTSYVQFDELETKEHDKLLPLSVAIAMRPKTGEIIDMCVATMNAKGHIAERSRAKYGLRIDTREAACSKVLSSVALCAKPGLTIASDAKSTYPNLTKAILPDARHEPRVNRHAKRADGFDMLFGINHTCALLRHDLSRLARRTWVTTKKVVRLQMHLDLYMAYKNGYVLT